MLFDLQNEVCCKHIATECPEVNVFSSLWVSVK